MCGEGKGVVLFENLEFLQLPCGNVIGYVPGSSASCANEYLFI